MSKIMEAYKMLTISDYKGINERYKTYGNVAMFFMLIIQIIQEILDTIYLERAVVGIGIIDVGINLLIFMNILKMRNLLYRQEKENKEDFLDNLKIYDGYVFSEHASFVYQNTIPFILIFNANMVDFSGTRFANKNSTAVFMTLKLIMILLCFLVIIISNIAKKYPSLKRISGCSIYVLDTLIYSLMAVMLLTLRHQRITFGVFWISVLILLLLIYIPSKLVKIVWKSLIGVLLAFGLLVVVTDEIIMQVKPYQFEEYMGVWLYEKDDIQMKVYCEIEKDDDNNKLSIYYLATNSESVLLDYDLREYDIEAYEMNKVLGTWYDHQGIIGIKEKQLKDNAIPIQISILKETIIHEAQSMNIDDDIYMYQNGEIINSGLMYSDEIVEGEKKYSLIILGDELWLYGYLPFTEIDAIPENVLSLIAT